MPLPKEKIYTSEDYWNLPEGQRAELIDGQLYDMAPPYRIHQDLVFEIAAAIRDYIRKNSGDCKTYIAPFAVNLSGDDSTWVEPDISVICNPDKLSDRGCEGAPDWIIEITSKSTRYRDYGIKLFKYRSAGVRLYWIVNPETRTVTVNDFENDRRTDQYGFTDDIPAGIFPGLSINISALPV